MTLDEYLADVDRWKAEAQAELDSLSDEQRKARLLEVRRKFEQRLDEPLRELTTS